MVAGRVGVVGAQDQGRLEGLQPRGQRDGHAGAGGDQRVGRQEGAQQAGRGKCVESALDEQQGVEGQIGGRQPEAAAGLAGAGGQTLESAPVGRGAGADEFGADGLAERIATQEDGVLAGVGVQQALAMAELELGVGEAALGAQEIAHGRPSWKLAK